MLSILYGEALKLKRSKMLWLIPLGALLPTLLNFFVVNHQLETMPAIVWTNLFNDNITLMAMLMCPSLFALFTGYLFAREYQDRTINSFLTVPRSRMLLLFGKYLIMLPVILLILILAFGLTLLIGFSLKHEALTAVVLKDALLKYALLFVTEYALISVAAMVSILGKSYIPAMGLGVFAVISELTIMQSKYIMYYPWSIPLNLLLKVAPDYNNVSLGVSVLAGSFIVPLLINMIYYRNADVHSG